MKVRVIDCISPPSSDIDIEAVRDARETDTLSNRCVAAVTSCLGQSSNHFTDVERGHLSQIFSSMRHAHRAIRNMLTTDGKDPSVVEVMSLVRGQLETLYAMCLVVEDTSSLSLYLKDGWKKIYVRHLLAREEGAALPRVTSDLRLQAVHIEKFRIVSGVSKAEQWTVDAEELGIAMPAGVETQKIQQFPTPLGVLNRIQETGRNRMLRRLYPEYQYLCGFVHFSPASIILTTLLDAQQLPAQFSTTGEKYEIFQNEIALPALTLDLLSIVQSCCEFITVFPGNIELARAVSDGWKFLSEGSILGRAIWQIRPQKLLGVIS